VFPFDLFGDLPTSGSGNIVQYHSVVWPLVQSFCLHIYLSRKPILAMELEMSLNSRAWRCIGRETCDPLVLRPGPGILTGHTDRVMTYRKIYCSD
jgi:hypothetical protein